MLVVIWFSMTISGVAMNRITPSSRQCLQTRSARVNEHQVEADSGLNRYELASLLAQCDFNAPRPKDMQAWDHMRPVGREF